MPKSFPSMYTNLQHKIITSDDYEYHAFKMLQIKSKTIYIKIYICIYIYINFEE